ncbi:ferric reductase [Campylobacter jejuni]|uniref:ferric reductase n=1 Tax=Campylobacter jejuni TaxID=197 RepID=UPI0005CEF54F|nr:ferric reductase [Campylobacter jejuni]KJD97949.1 ferric reductase [Campylobacter jejuni subsp. jejuni]
MQIKYFKFLAYFGFIISLIYGFYHIIKAFDFVKEAYIYTGIFALIFLNLSLLFSLLKFKKTKNYPKILGIFDDISHRLLEASGFIAFLIIFLMLLSSFKIFKKLSKIRKLGYLCLVLASYHYFLTPKVPMFWEWSALIVALFYFIVRYTKTLKKLKSNNLTFIKT